MTALPVPVPVSERLPMAAAAAACGRCRWTSRSCSSSFASSTSRRGRLPRSIGRDNRLSLNEWRVMLVLASHPGAAAQEVALHTGLDKMTVSRALAALARQGRLVRKEDAADKRRTTIRLSAAGQRVFERIAASGRQREAQLFAAIDVADRDRLSKTLDGLVEALLALEAAKPA